MLTLSPGDWIAIITSIAIVASSAGFMRAQVAAMQARVDSLERGNIDGKKRLGALVGFCTVVNYKLFGRQPPITPHAQEEGLVDREARDPTSQEGAEK